MREKREAELLFDRELFERQDAAILRQATFSISNLQ